MLDNNKIKDICQQTKEHLFTQNLHTFLGRKDELICISSVYIGVWLEHVYDSVMLAKLYPEKGISVAHNTIKAFIENQTTEGQYPCYIWDKNLTKSLQPTGYGQMQECASFGKMCLLFYELSHDKNFLRECYFSLQKWVWWQEKYRMTTKRGLVEMFVGFDTGHDNSHRNKGMKYPENRSILGTALSAQKKPSKLDKVAPILAVDMNACFYGNLVALATMEEILLLGDGGLRWREKANDVKQNLFTYCFNKEDCFFYDVDKYNRQIKVPSCAILSLFQEGVLDIKKDKLLIEDLCAKHIFNKKEFWTEYPFPSVAYSYSSRFGHKKSNDWGYFTQGNTALRTTLWMDKYNFSEEQDTVCKKWLEGWTNIFDTLPVGQELDPVTGTPSPSSPWYSTGMLFYLYSAKRLLHY